jgi:hypothetical protein
MQTEDPHELLVRHVPRLRMWRDEMDNYRDTPMAFYSRLASEVVELAADGVIPVLADLAPVIEHLLLEFDEQDAVSIGFVENLQALVEERRLDSRKVRGALGELAQAAWDGLYLYRYQLDYCQIDYRGTYRRPAHGHGSTRAVAGAERRARRRRATHRATLHWR